ncbi:MAG: lamin tail domain-containing protein, partial [Candidatus Latescibacteria bacterium]|nr:lamin tail domain-containing protein [Candidatus Latescibacterota bacterium]
MRLIFLVLWLMPGLSIADDVGVTLGQNVGIASDTLQVPVILQSTEPLSGVAFTVSYEEEKIEFLGFVNVHSPFDVFENRAVNKVVSVFLNPNSTAHLEAGKVQLALMSFRIRPASALGKVELIGSQLSVTSGDNAVQEMSGEINSGAIVITNQVMQPQPVTWVSKDVLRIGIDLHNTQSISGIQMQVRLPSLLRLKDIQVTDRTASWQEFYQSQDSTVYSILMTDLQDQTSIQPGDGFVAHLDLSVPVQPISLGVVFIDSLLVTDHIGQVIPVSGQSKAIDWQDFGETPIAGSVENDSPPDSSNILSDELLADDQLPVAEVDQNNSGVDGEGPKNSQDTRDPNEMNIRIVEILADPPPGLHGDANRDGIRGSRADEFVELFNTGTEAVDLSGWYLGDDDVAVAEMFQFENNTSLEPNERAVIFGGGSPNGIPGIVFIDDGSIGNGLTNSGDIIMLLNALGDTVDVVRYHNEGGKDQSLYYDGETFRLHTETVGSAVFSPGEASATTPPSLPNIQESGSDTVSNNAESGHDTSAEGSGSGEVALGSSVGGGADSGQESLGIDTSVDSISSGLNTGSDTTAQDSTETGEPTRVISDTDSSRMGIDGHIVENVTAVIDSSDAQANGANSGASRSTAVVLAEKSILVVEILADPPPGLEGDVNGDGIRDSREDEFVEILNTGDRSVDLGGWRLGDDDVALPAMFTFGQGVILEPGQRIVVFGGGLVKDIEGIIFVDDGSIGNGLTNSGDKIVLINAFGDTIDTVDFGRIGGQNQSLSRENDGLFLHGEGEG